MSSMPRDNDLPEPESVFDRLVATLTEYDISNSGAGALTLQIFGGADRTRRGRPVRGQIHMGFIAGKRTNIPGLVDYLTRINPHSAKVNAANSTYTGLTGPVRSLGPNSGWYLDEGALTDDTTKYLAIQNPDELDGKSKNCLEEAVGSGGVTISKKGFHETVAVTASILLIGSPVYGDWDQYEPLKKQVPIPDDLESRFDFVFPDFPKDKERPKSGYIEDVEGIQRYISEAQKTSPEIQPHIESELFEGLVEIHVEKLEKDSVPQSARDTARRLAVASAKTRMAAEVTPTDVGRAMAIYRRPFEEFHGIDRESVDFGVEKVPTGSAKNQERRQFKQLFADDTHWDDSDLVKAGMECGLKEWEIHRLIGELEGRGKISQDVNGNWFARGL